MALYLALPICRAGPDTSRDLCALFDARAPAIAGLMDRFATLYADPRLALDADDPGFWRRAFGCAEPAASPPMPREKFRPISELLTTIADRQLRGLEPLDGPASTEWTELIGDFGDLQERVENPLRGRLVGRRKLVANDGMPGRRPQGALTMPQDPPQIRRPRRPRRRR